MSNLLTAEVKQCLKLNKGLNIIVVVGNSFRRDDGVGPYIASQLKSAANLMIFDAGITPENIIDKVICLNPSYLIFIDAADFNGIPGEIRNIAKHEISEYALSTHTVPLGVIVEIIESETKAEIGFIGIQPWNTGFGEGLSAEVQQSANEIVKEINRLSEYK